MRLIFAIATLILAINPAFTQSWIASTGLTSSNDITYIQSHIDKDQNVYLFGSFSEVITAGITMEANSAGGNDYFLCKFNKDGEPSWITAIGGQTDEDLVGGMVLTQDGEIMVSGGYSDTIFTMNGDTLLSSGSFDIFLSKYTSDGDEVWIKDVVKGRDLQRASHLSIDKDENLILTGQFRDSTSFDETIAPSRNNLNLNGFYSKFYSLDGTMIWWKSIESLNGKDGVLLTKSSSSADQIILIGSFSDSIVIENDTIVSRDASKDGITLNTNANGKVNWVNFMVGASDEQAQSLIIDKNKQIYVLGQYNSPFLKPDYSTPDSLFETTNLGGSDLYMTKYSPAGQLDWLITTGGRGDDMISESELKEDSIIVSGYFSDTLIWGDAIVKTRGESDKDLFLGYMDTSGAFKRIKTLTGSGNSHEESKATLHSGSNNGYGMIYSNASLLQVGDDIITSPQNKFQITLGILGCKTISIDYLEVKDVLICSGDSTGSIQVFASGGFGGPYRCSIDPEDEFKYYNSTISNLPEGIYHISVMDREFCQQSGPTAQILEPDPLVIEVISKSDISADADGFLVIGALGGTSPYTYTLLPNGETQSFGTFIFPLGSSGKYVVEVDDINLCGPVKTDSIKIRDLTNPDGFGDFSGITLKVFPNPATDLVTIEMPMEASEVTMEVLSLAGKVMMVHQAYTTGGVLRETIDVSDLAQGMYMLRVNGQTLKSAIVVQ